MSKVKATFAQISLVKNNFKESACVLPISVGQPYHEAEKLFATIELVNKYFAKCVIIVCDSLQRYTSMLYGNISETMAYTESIRAGDSWLERNKAMIEQFSIPYRIRKWNDWYKNESFSGYLEKIDNLCKIDYAFKQVLDSCANQFIENHLERYNENVFSISTEDAICLCKKYLKEEAAVLLMWQEEDYDFLAYPGSNNAIIANIRSYFFSDDEELNKLSFLKIKFKK